MVSPDKLVRYRDFVDPENTGCSYDPRKGLARILSTLTPDTKGVTLAAMNGVMYCSQDELVKEVGNWLVSLGLSPKIYPITDTPTWGYCQRRNKDGFVVDGSLVDLGAVVKKTEDSTGRIYFTRSTAGLEIILPLVQQSIEFVYLAGHSKFPHRFDASVRVLGDISSPKDHRRQLAIHDVVKFLVENPGKHNKAEILNKIETLTAFDPDKALLSNVLTNLGICGIIDCESPLVYQEGLPTSGWSTYIPEDVETFLLLDPRIVYQRIRTEYPDDEIGLNYLTRMINYIKEHVDEEYERGKISKALGYHKYGVSHALVRLESLGYLKRSEGGFRGRNCQSLAWANDLTPIFYKMVLEPSRNIAEDLIPLPMKAWDRDKVGYYLDNYKTERNRSGIQEGERIRSFLLLILSGSPGQAFRLNHIVCILRAFDPRMLEPAAYSHHLRLLRDRGKVEQPKEGYYQITDAGLSLTGKVST